MRRVARNHRPRSKATPHPKQSRMNMWWNSIGPSTGRHRYMTSTTSMEMRSTMKKPMLICTAPRIQLSPIRQAGLVVSSAIRPSTVDTRACEKPNTRSQACALNSTVHRGCAQRSSRKLPQMATAKTTPSGGPTSKNWIRSEAWPPTTGVCTKLKPSLVASDPLPASILRPSWWTKAVPQAWSSPHASSATARGAGTPPSGPPRAPQPRSSRKKPAAASAARAMAPSLQARWRRGMRGSPPSRA
mmetsp:Transcript_7540/g.19309  ORF Transcript_7540/g.19309 Transcript_7540/m.19309 type:complete len:244 (+) Transcript_7540:375-1106(+)